MDLSPTDLIRAFLAAAQKQGITACVVFAYQENDALKMSMSSNTDEARTRVALEWVTSQVLGKSVPPLEPLPPEPKPS